jgi:hypothetical protein
MLFAILFIVLVSFQTEVFGADYDPLMQRAFEDWSDDDTVDRNMSTSNAEADEWPGQTAGTTNSATSPQNVIIEALPWDVSRHIEKLAKEYVEHCEKTTEVKISRNHVLGPLLGFPKCHRHKNKTKTITLAWIAEKRNEAEIHHNALTAEHSEYQTQLACYDEIQELSESTTYISDERAEEILQKELAFMEWRSRILRQDIPAIRAYAANLEVIIEPQAKLLKLLNNFHAKRLVTSREGAIKFVLQNVEAPHADFFAAHRAAIEKYITDTYYPDVEDDAATE